MVTPIVGADFLVNTTTSSSQSGSSIAALGDGRFIVCWQSHIDGTDDDHDVRGQIFNADGTPVGEEFILSGSSVRSGAPSIAVLNDGNFVVSWEQWEDDVGDISARIFDTNGVPQGDAFLANTTTANFQYAHEIVALQNGGFAITWSHENGQPFDVRGRIFDADGVAAGPDFSLPASLGPGSKMPSIASLSDGGFVVAWHGWSTGSTVTARMFDADGEPTSEDIVIVPNIGESGFEPSVVGLSGGRFVVTWQAHTNSSSTSPDIKAQLFNADGSPAGDSFIVNTTVPGDQYRPGITALDDGGFAIGWSSQEGDENSVRARLFNSDGVPLGDDFQVSSTETPSGGGVHLVPFADGKIAVTWYSHGGDVLSFDIRAAIVTLDPVIRGTDQGDVLIGGAAPDLISGGGGDDRLLGAGGDDDLDGGTGNDFLNGEGGNDLLDGGEGADHMWGAAGDDTYIVDNAGDSVVEGPGGGVDTVHSPISYALGTYAENLALESGDIDSTGNKFDNLITGSAGDNTLSGMIGKDRLEGGAGDDTLIGGRDSDTFVFKPGFGHDTIDDFAVAGSYSAIGPAHDVLEFDSTIFADLADVLDHSQDTAQGVLVTAEAGDTLLIKNTTMATLQAHPEDFQFA
jgi:hypothetical protein